MVDNASKYSSNLLVGKTKTVSCRSNFLQYVSRNGNRSDPGETSYKFGTSEIEVNSKHTAPFSFNRASIINKSTTQVRPTFCNLE